MTAAAVIEARGLSAAIGGRTIVRDLSIRVEAGEVLALLGPNGTGKSTVLSVLGLRRRPAAGQVLLDGERVDDLRGRPLLAARRHVACVFQKPLLLSRTVAHNVELGLALRKVPARRRKKKAREAMEQLGIAALASRRADKLSGGEAQRASIARALAIEPRVLLLDEPFAGLDEGTRRQLIAEVTALVASREIATVLVTHDQTEALALSTRTALLSDGRVVQHGTTRKVLSEPVDERVATFLGFENRIEGKGRSTEGEAGAIAAVGAGLELRLSSMPESEELTLMFRAEDLRLRWDNDLDAPNRFRATIRRIVHEGFPTRLLLDSVAPLTTLVPTRLVESRGLREGTDLVVEVAPEAIRVFPRQRRS